MMSAITGRREITLIGVIRAFRVLHARDQFRNHEVDVGISLPVSMAWQVDRHAGYGLGEVRAVIEIESAQEVLIRLAASGVRAGNHARHGFEHFTYAQQRAHIELTRRNRSLAGGLRHADEVLGRIFHVREIGEGALAHDGDLRADRDVHHGINPCHPRAHLDVATEDGRETRIRPDPPSKAWCKTRHVGAWGVPLDNNDREPSEGLKIRHRRGFFPTSNERGNITAEARI